MQAELGFHGPFQYSPAWLWAGVALLALVAGWYAAVLAATRRRRHLPGDRRPVALTDLAALKAAYLERIDNAERSAAAGRLSLRAAHQEISLVLRSFIRDATGVDALRMTRQDLERHPLPAAAAAVGALYPGEFGPEPLPSASASAEVARKVVRAWA
ncbi:hypothetical protein FDW83_00270 [Pseudarthrobacter sp. NamE2]|uniref:hypothetical protein n=1 Tax=Pseudarthrobacter sp. NamE2 TaxID=2576838 RepID=UPI0010FDDEF9|nr:hypothetical protein [Pseudarthrobacter sp. NamE2]TLM86242.1 hypothetical protein FDW83_00270 [Pseudarthrobacter sp. NamE2]